MKTLVVYYSRSGNNEVLAHEFHNRFDADLMRIEEVKPRTLLGILIDMWLKRVPAIKQHRMDLRDYRRFIFVAPVWGGMIASPLKAFLMEERENIECYSFISICGGHPGQRQRIEEELGSLMGRKPEIVGELWINDLLPVHEKGKILYASGFRITGDHLKYFSGAIEAFWNVAHLSFSKEKEHS